MPDLFSGTQYAHAPKETLRLPSEMRTIYKIWGWLILFACSLPLVALPQKDSVCLYFPKGYATWNPTYRDNDVTFKNLRSRLEKLRADSSSYLVELHISGNASPDGLTSANVKLSGKRAATILKLLRDYISIPDSLLNVTANGIDWKFGCFGLSGPGLPPATRDPSHPAKHARMDLRRPKPDHRRTKKTADGASGRNSIQIYVGKVFPQPA